MNDLLSPAARRLLALLSREPFPISIADGNSQVIQELMRYGLISWTVAGITLSREGIRIGNRYDLIN